MARLIVDSDRVKLPGNCHKCYMCFGGYCPISPSETDGCCEEEGRPEWCPLSIAPEPEEKVNDRT